MNIVEIRELEAEFQAICSRADEIAEITDDPGINAGVEEILLRCHDILTKAFHHINTLEELYEKDLNDVCERLQVALKKNE